MAILEISPFAGLNKRFPQHKLTSSKKDGKQKCIELLNMMNIDGRVRKVNGGERYNSTAVAGDVKWAKRIYYNIGSDKFRFQFMVAGGKMYRGNDNDRTMQPVTISDSYDISIDPTVYPIDATLKVAEQVSTFLVDGTYFYKFNGNASGVWERLPIKSDIDGNVMEPVFICEYLDRMAVLCKDRNVLILSPNLDPENFDDSTDAVLIELPPGNGGFPQALIVHRGFLFIIHEDYFVPLSGSSPATFGVKPGDVISGFGTRAPRSVVEMKTQFGFLNSYDNEYYLTSGSVDSTMKSPLSYEIQIANLINPVKAHLTCAYHDERFNVIRVNMVPTGSVLLNYEVLYSLTEEKWCGETLGREISCYSPWDGNGDQNELLTGRSDIGAMMFNDVGLNWDGAAIHYKFVSASYVVPESPTIAQFRELFVEGKPTGNFGIPVSYYIDARITTSSDESVNMQGEGISLGLIIIADQLVFTNRALFKIDYSRGRMIRLQVEENVLNRDLEFYSMYLSYNIQNSPYSKAILGR